MKTNEEKNVWRTRKSEATAIRQLLVVDLAKEAFDAFQKRAKLSEEEMKEFLKVTRDATVVFTQPSAETLKADAESESPRFTKGRAFGSVTWYKKQQVVESSLNVFSSYSSYLSYMESKENQQERDNKKLAAAAELLGISIDELKALKKK